MQILGYQMEALSRGNQQDWQPIEATLFCIRMTASEVNTATSQTLPQFLEALPKLPNQKFIRYTSTLIVGRYAAWLLQRFAPI